MKTHSPFLDVKTTTGGYRHVLGARKSRRFRREVQACPVRNVRQPTTLKWFLVQVQGLFYFLILILVSNCFLFLVARPGAPSSVLAPSSDSLCS